MPTSWYSHVFMDPSDIEKFYANEDSMSNSMTTGSEELSEDSLDSLEKIKDVLPKIPPREADFVELYYFNRMRQAAIADLFGVSQPTVCYRLQRAQKRIRYLIDLPPYNDSDLDRFLNFVLQDQTDIEIMKGMLETTCQSEVARLLNASQGFVRHRFYRSMKKIQRYSGEEAETYHRIFQHLSRNMNVLKSDDKLEKTEPTIYILQ
jgi:DNA-directed RNA polymerase specialized sigma24 family protein